MWDVNQRQKKSSRPSLSQWLHQAIAEPEVELRIRLRGNILHLLCEGSQAPDRAQVMSRLASAIEERAKALGNLLKGAKDPVYKILVYGRAQGKQRPAWIEPISLAQFYSPETSELRSSPNSNPPRKATATAPQPMAAQIASNEDLARMGSTEAIARYLSESFSHLGVSIKTLVQKLPESQAASPAEPTANKRLWVVCNCDYSPDATLLAEPIAQKLRDLELKGFREAVIRAQVSGEATPDWVLQVDLTSPEAMLRDWARWGDAEAIARALERSLNPQGVQVHAVLKDTTLHVFCSLLPGQSKSALDCQTVVDAIAPLLEEFAPQGITAATLYGVEGPKFSLDLPEAPIWVDWVNLPAAQRPELAPSPWDLARQNHPAALTFLLQRLLNPNLQTRLATGGLRVKLCSKENLLHILTEGSICPPQGQVVPPIEETLRKLLIPGIKGARMYGRRAGQASPLWSYKVDFLVGTKTATSRAQESASTSTAEAEAPTTLLTPEVSDPLPASPNRFRSSQSKGIDQATEELRQGLARLLCSSQLFIPFEGPQLGASPLYAEGREKPSPYRGLRRVAIWGALGLLLSVQTDWLLGRMLRINPAPAALDPLAPTAQAAQEPARSDLEVSLDPSSATLEGFNQEPFAENQDNSATAAAILASARSSNPTFNNRLLDEKLALYQERIRTQGVPDVLIVGSSRAMRGIDPETLQQEMAKRGTTELDIFNFGINGATAQVVDFLLRQVLTPEQLPKLIVWADGARAFNSGRPDRTYEAIASSIGYQQLKAGNFPQQNSKASPTENEEKGIISLKALSEGIGRAYQSFDGEINEALANLSAIYPQREQLKAWARSRLSETIPSPPAAPRQSSELDELADTQEAIDIDGFLPLSVRFNPETYYTNHPRVAGAYDSDYDSFDIKGKQYEALRNLTEFLNGQGVELVFVNLPLTKEYLDPVRSQYEQEFTQSMQQAAANYGMIFRDLGQRWPTEYDLFSDPSHLNRYGADRVSLHLAQDPTIPWQQ